MTNASPLEHEGRLADADAVGMSGSLTAGPGVRISLKVDDETIVAAGFETFAFDAARPVADALCGLLVGATVDEASHLSVIDVARIGSVGPTTPIARTVHYAKSSALMPWFGRRARHGASLTCTCFHVPTDEIVSTIRRHGFRSIDELKTRLPVTTGCGTCRPDVQRLLDAESPPTAPDS